MLASRSHLPTSPLHEHARLNRIAHSKDLAKEALSQLKEAGLDKRRLAAFEEQLCPLTGAVQDNPESDNKFEISASTKP